MTVEQGCITLYTVVVFVAFIVNRNGLSPSGTLNEASESFETCAHSFNKYILGVLLSAVKVFWPNLSISLSLINSIVDSI